MIAALVFLAVLAALLAVSACVACGAFGLHNRYVRQKGDRAGQASWEDKGPTPLGEKRYTPQGLAWAQGKIIFANTWKNTRSRVYQIDPRDMQILASFDMPPEAVHTSGLAWDGRRLWAVDHVANRGYCLDLTASLASGRATVLGWFDTTLRGTSACCLVPWHGKLTLAISDFMHSRRTIVVDHEEALRSGSAKNAILFAYGNEGFSQGLEYAEGFLYEAENKAGTDVINRIDPARLALTRSARKATVRQYAAPGGGVEDLAWDGRAMWTSDETVFRFFKGRLE